MRYWQLGILALIAVGCAVANAEPLTFESHLVYVQFIGVSYRPRQHGAGMTYGDCEAVAALGLDWTHGWQRNPTVCPGVEAVPQISYLGEIGRDLGGNSRYVIYLNEPESPYQSNVPDPLDAAAGLEDLLAEEPHRVIVLPSAPLGYLTTMWDAGEFPADRVAANGHCYGWGYLGTALTKCKAHADDLRAWADARGIDEVWVTEFGYDPAWQGMDATEAFMREMIAHYWATGIDRWAWFQVNSTAGRWSSGELGLWVDGEMTELGEAYK